MEEPGWLCVCGSIPPQQSAYAPGGPAGCGKRQKGVFDMKDIRCPQITPLVTTVTTTQAFSKNKIEIAAPTVEMSAMPGRRIVHVDMDAFFASVEQRDNPDLKGKPVIVCESLGSRGVVSTASYEARKFGVHSAMPLWKARQLCPDGIFLQARIDAYKAVSGQIKDIFLEYTDLVEPVALDEAYLDVTDNKKGISSTTDLARDIQARIYGETGLTASAGVSFNMFLAKTASDMHKPNGLTEITEDQAGSLMDSLPIGEFYGVGEVTEAKFRNMGVENGAGLKKLSPDDLGRLFGKPGRDLYNLVRGKDERIVTPNRPRKSIGREITLQADTKNIEEILGSLAALSTGVEKLLHEEKLCGRTVTLKLKYYDFTSITRQQALKEFTDDAVTFFNTAAGLLKKTKAGEWSVRLVGIAVSGFAPAPEIVPVGSASSVQAAAAAHDETGEIAI